LSLIGVNISALIAGAGVGGIAAALASKDMLANLFGSLSLIFGKFFEISDRIRIKTFEGTVEEISLGYTRLTAADGHTIFVPNKFLTAEPIENLTNGHKEADAKKPANKKSSKK
jgi:MscS family membrane protein